MDEQVVREQLVNQLDGKQAHASAEQALAGLEPRLRAARPAAGQHSVWDVLEHMRVAQQDILRYTLDASWESPKFPDGYWPGATDRVDDATWEASLAGFRADLAEVCALARDAKLDLTARLPHGKWRTYLRQILLVADHNAYHLGQIVQLRKTLGAWS
jgi:uncharacterized damage-inducible protein DinB